jgi:hexosaminidase
MIFPRMSALSEVLWSPKDKRDLERFRSELPDLYKRYQLWDANYFKE